MTEEGFRIFPSSGLTFRVVLSTRGARRCKVPENFPRKALEPTSLTLPGTKLSTRRSIVERSATVTIPVSSDRPAGFKAVLIAPASSRTDPPFPAELKSSAETSKRDLSRRVTFLRAERAISPPVRPAPFRPAALMVPETRIDPSSAESENFRAFVWPVISTLLVRTRKFRDSVNVLPQKASIAE